VVRNILLLALAFSMSPGLVELAEDSVNIALDGHSDHEEGEDACPEHGCTPLSHHCGCCTSIAVTVAPDVDRVPVSIPVHGTWVSDAHRPGPKGTRARLLRPPRA